ncbi:uncharacterized protein OCT59_005015 [Rhizophagus irregularis]|uniref:uncharacterized protein n=1 Tax=Rhizophagus irregularis TaxID=588596 RepID=UPI003333F398|nr:hypothetical protein OCT59_005015 [Rhizophagus irregularis]
MKAYIIIIKIFYVLYLIACICAEIWYLITLRKIGDYNDHDIKICMFLTIYTSSFYFLWILSSLSYILIYPYNVNEENIYVFFISITPVTSNVIISLLFGLRYRVPDLNLGKIPFNCNYDYDLPENIKIVCKAKFISCTLGFFIYTSPLVSLLIILLNYLVSEITYFIKENSHYLQKNLFVL